MTTSELIKKLQELDPSGQKQVKYQDWVESIYSQDTITIDVVKLSEDTHYIKLW